MSKRTLTTADIKDASIRVSGLLQTIIQTYPDKPEEWKKHLKTAMDLHRKGVIYCLKGVK